MVVVETADHLAGAPGDEGRGFDCGAGGWRVEAHGRGQGMDRWIIGRWVDRWTDKQTDRQRQRDAEKCIESKVDPTNAVPETWIIFTVCVDTKVLARLMPYPQRSQKKEREREKETGREGERESGRETEREWGKGWTLPFSLYIYIHRSVYLSVFLFTLISIYLLTYLIDIRIATHLAGFASLQTRPGACGEAALRFVEYIDNPNPTALLDKADQTPSAFFGARGMMDVLDIFWFFCLKFWQKVFDACFRNFLAGKEKVFG